MNAQPPSLFASSRNAMSFSLVIAALVFLAVGLGGSVAMAGAYTVTASAPSAVSVATAA